MPAGCTHRPHAGVAGAPTKAPSSLAMRGCGHGGLARAPPELPRLGGEKTREELGRTGQKWKSEVGFTLKNTWPWCRLCLHPGRTASSYSLTVCGGQVTHAELGDFRVATMTSGCAVTHTSRTLPRPRTHNFRVSQALDLLFLSHA